MFIFDTIGPTDLHLVWGDKQATHPAKSKYILVPFILDKAVIQLSADNYTVRGTVILNRQQILFQYRCAPFFFWNIIKIWYNR